jgi:hypothetical protein
MLGYIHNEQYMVVLGDDGMWQGNMPLSDELELTAKYGSGSYHSVSWPTWWVTIIPQAAAAYGMQYVIVDDASRPSTTPHEGEVIY